MVDRGVNIPPSGFIMEKAWIGFFALCYKDKRRTTFTSDIETIENRGLGNDQYVSSYPFIRLAPVELVQWE